MPLLTLLCVLQNAEKLKGCEYFCRFWMINFLEQQVINFTYVLADYTVMDSLTQRLISK